MSAFAAAATALASAIVTAFAGQVMALSRSQAVHLALSQGPDLAEAEPSVEIARAAIGVAGQLPNPTIGFSAGPDEPTIYGTLEQRLPIFGQHGAAIGAARAEARTAEAELEARRLEIRVTVQRGYTALALAQSELELARQAASLARDLADRARAKVAAGLAPQLDAEQAALQAARAEQESLDRAAALREAQGAMSRTLGVAPDTAVAAADALSVPTDANPSAEVHPAVRAAQLDVDDAAARVSREKAAVRPMPVVGIELERLNPGPDTPASLGVRGSIGLDLPVLSWNRGAIDREEATGRSARAHLRAVTARLDAQRRVARVRLDAAEARARFHEETLVPQARRVADLARAAYDLGRAPLVTLLLALTDLNRAQVGAAEAAAQAWDAREDLEEVSGALE